MKNLILIAFLLYGKAIMAQHLNHWSRGYLSLWSFGGIQKAPNFDKETNNKVDINYPVTAQYGIGAKLLYNISDRIGVAMNVALGRRHHGIALSYDISHYNSGQSSTGWQEIHDYGFISFTPEINYRILPKKNVCPYLIIGWTFSGVESPYLLDFKGFALNGQSGVVNPTRFDVQSEAEISDRLTNGFTFGLGVQKKIKNGDLLFADLIYEYSPTIYIRGSYDFAPPHNVQGTFTNTGTNITLKFGYAFD